MAFSAPDAVVPDNLKCCICLELFSDPRVLPCFHTYCLRCLQGLVSDKKSDLSCPQCRAKHEIPKDGVASYLSDLSILPELEVAKGQGQKKICGFCTTGEVAVGYCNDCCEYLCEYCQDVMHKRGKMFATHSITSLEALSTITCTFKKPSLCSQHPDYKLEIFCKTCDTLVCCMCMLETTHKGHSYDFVKNVQDELMKRIKSMTQNIEKKEKEFKSCLVSVQNFEQQVCSRRDKLENEINSTCDEYITKIQAMKEELLKQVESKFTEDSKTIWATKDHLEVMLYQIQSCRAFSERYQKQGSEGQMLPLINQLLRCLAGLESAVADASIIFTSAIPLTKFKKSPLKLSHLGTLSVAKDATFIQGRLQNTFCNANAKTTLVYLLNKPLARLVKWECRYSHSDNITSSCPVVVAGDNRLEIEFTPTLLGVYTFELIPIGYPIVGIQKFFYPPKPYFQPFKDTSVTESPNLKCTSSSNLSTFEDFDIPELPTFKLTSVSNLTTSDTHITELSSAPKYTSDDKSNTWASAQKNSISHDSITKGHTVTKGMRKSAKEDILCYYSSNRQTTSSRDSSNRATTSKPIDQLLRETTSSQDSSNRQTTSSRDSSNRATTSKPIALTDQLLREKTSSRDSSNRQTTSSRDSSNRAKTSKPIALTDQLLRERTNSQDSSNRQTTSSRDSSNRATTSKPIALTDQLLRETTSSQDSSNRQTTSSRDSSNRATTSKPIALTDQLLRETTSSRDSSNRQTTSNQDSSNKQTTNSTSVECKQQ